VRHLLVEERELIDRYAKRKLRQIPVIEEDRGADQPDPAVAELLPELASEDADPFVLVDTLLVEMEKQVEMEIDDVVVDATHPCIEVLGRPRHHSVIMANVATPLDMRTTSRVRKSLQERPAGSQEQRRGDVRALETLPEALALDAHLPSVSREPELFPG
jgi:hypothetical protein